MKEVHHISSKTLDIATIRDLIRFETPIKLSKEAEQNINDCRAYLDHKMESNEDPIYGINTGFGSLYDIKISNENLTKLQENLMLSHACGIGEQVPIQIVKLMLFLKIKSLSYGHSGVQLQTVNRLIEFYNHNVIPVVYTQGSLGASGDLAPLAHLSLPIIGEGEVWYKGEKFSGKEICEKFNWKPIKLKSKEGLALLNGTQFMSAYGVYVLVKAFKLSYFADLIGTLSLEAYDGTKEPFNELVHLVRPHKGQINTSRRVLEFLEGSELIERKGKHVQDPYCFRCIPQVHGATKDALEFAKRTFETEINSVTDNPNIFVKDDKIISGGNFHGQPLALAFDFLKIAMSELGNISERRTFQLISGLRNLPSFLVKDPGLNSGFMIPQYTAASIVSANKQLATPASIDSVVSSNGQEDHVSMGANAGVQARQLVDNVERILAIELLNASQALYFRLPEKTSPFLEAFLEAYRKEVKMVENDRFLHVDIQHSISFINSLSIDNEVVFS